MFFFQSSFLPEQGKTLNQLSSFHGSVNLGHDLADRFMLILMGWESFKIMSCPFCDIGRIKVRHVPILKKEQFASGSAFSKRTTTYTREHYTVLEDCPNCGKSKKEIEKRFATGEAKSIGHKELLERLRKAGLPTTV